MIETLADLLHALTAAEPQLYIFGGVAEDAVLDGALTRPHSDVDVMLPRHDLDRRLEQFRGWGYAEWETWLANSQGQPQVLHSADHPVEFEISILEGEPGSYWFEFENPAGGHFRFFPPADLYDHAPVDLDGIAVRTLHPRALYLIRAALTEAGSFGPLREKDIAVQPRLRALLADCSTADLAPRLETAP